MRRKVWVVWHIDHDAPTAEQENEKLVGVYSSKRLARAHAAIGRLGFKGYPDR